MPRFSRLDVLNRLLEGALVPIFYQKEPETMCRIVSATASAGVPVFEFTNRGDHAIDVFAALERHCKQHLPNVILGAGTIVDDATAALFIAHGANFIVGPTFDERIARLCNRRKVAYVPGCQTANEILAAEEAGVEIIKLFPSEAAGGPEFVKRILGPSPWTRLMPTGLTAVTQESLKAWFDAGVCAVGVGSDIIRAEFLAAADYDSIARRTQELRQWVSQARGIR